MRALIERGDLERTARSSRALLEDQRDLLARQALRLVAGLLGRLERLRETQEMQELVAAEVDLLEEAAIAHVVQGYGSRSIGQVMQCEPPRPPPSSEPSIVMTSIPSLRSRVLASTLRS